MTSKPVTAILVGAGDRGMLYSSLANIKPELLKIVGVADPDPTRRLIAMRTFGFSEDMCFENAETLARHGKLADVIINATMDQQHRDTAIPLLNEGYDMLLEKPFAVNEKEMWEIVECAKKNDSTIMICHVLRYAPFYNEIKKRVMSGVIGEIKNIQTTEHVSFEHTSVSYVRGKWSNSDICKTSMLLAKCCHDVDLIMWLMSDIKPVAVSSFGSNFQYKPEKAPKNSGTVCMKDCPLVDECPYSTKLLNVNHPIRWGLHVWKPFQGKETPTVEERVELMKNADYPYAKCIYKSNNNVVDHQSVLINFENGATATHNMVGGTPRPARNIHIIGTKGEIFGDFESQRFTINTLNPNKISDSPDFNGYACDTEVVDLQIKGDTTGAFGGHGGGDLRLAEDFVRIVSGEEPSIACTSIYDSVIGHLCVYKADKSREENGAVQEINL